ncbi:MAG: cysteine peptidase family C39 domain-containing protein, partial [Myxococcota bacterium]|nr:cysteine peptidase family C39 domain-containing protein [Myxococcota bacterium]
MRKTKIARCPVVLQMEANECGAASLGKVLGYHKKFVSLEELRDACGVSRDGCSALNVVNAANHYDMDAKVYKCESEDLKEEIAFPAILFWNDNHFIVLEGIDENVFYINDPANGRLKIGQNDFERCYSNIVIELEKTDDFKEHGKPPNIIESLPERLAGSKASIVMLFLGSVGLIFPELIAPFYLKIFIDDLLIDGKTSWLGPLLLGLLITTVLREGLSWIQKYLLIKLDTKLSIKESSSLLLHMLHLPLSFFYSRFSGDLANRLSLAEQIGALLSGSIAQPFFNLISIFFFGVVILFYS